MKKETAKKATQHSVAVDNGPLKGMSFTVEDQTPVEKGRVRVKYMAPGNGPRAVVEHRMVRGEFRDADKREDVRIAFSKLIPASIRWSADQGYSERTSGKALTWDHQLARFVHKPESSNAKASTQPEEDNSGELPGTEE